MLSIIIVNYKTRGLLKLMLRAIAKYPPQRAYEIIVVDNGSEDGSVELLREEFPDIKLIASVVNVGYAAGTNLGLQAARGDYVLLLNTDIVIAEGLVEKLCAYLAANPNVGGVGPKLINPDRTTQPSSYRFYRLLTPLYRRTWLKYTRRGQSEISRFLMAEKNFDQEFDADWLMSSCFLLRREAITKVGLFDERFFVYMADTDYCRRLWAVGYKVRYTPAVRFIHYHRRESAEEWRVARIHLIDWLKYIWKWRYNSSPQNHTEREGGKAQNVLE